MPPVLLGVARLALWLAILAAVFVPLERLFAVHPQRVLRREFATDLGYYFLNSLLTTVVLAVPMAVIAAVLHRLVPGAVLAAAAGLPFGVRLVAALVVGEIGFYWGHRWSHEVPLLWRFHAVHHSAEELDFLSNTRAHPVDIVFTRLCGFVPLYALGLAQAGGGRGALVPGLVVLVGTIWGFFIHANIRARFGWLEWLVSTPAFHRWHHTNDAYRDHNYASMLPVFDRIFGSHHLPRGWPPCYGIDAAMAPGLAGQLLQPLASPRPAREPGLAGPR